MTRGAAWWWLVGLVSSLLHVVALAPPDPVASSAAAPAAWVSRAVALPAGNVLSLASTPTAVYVLTRTVGGGASSADPSGTITSVDLANLGTRSSRPIRGADDLTVVGRTLWVSTITVPGSGSDAGPGSVRIARFSPTSLRPTGATLLAADLPSSETFTSVACVPGGPCWASAGPHLYRMDPTNGRVLSFSTLFFDIDSLSESANGGVLYAAGEGLSTANYQPPLVVQQLDARSGTVLASSSGVAVAGGTVSAAPDGVWVSARSGMAGSSYQLRQGALALANAPSAPLPDSSALGRASGTGGGPYESIGGVAGVVSDHVLWLSADAYLACADPTTAAVRGYELTGGRTSGGSAVVAVGRRLFLGGVNGLSVIHPPATCFE